MREVAGHSAGALLNSTGVTSGALFKPTSVGEQPVRPATPARFSSIPAGRSTWTDLMSAEEIPAGLTTWGRWIPIEGSAGESAAAVSGSSATDGLNGRASQSKSFV